MSKEELLATLTAMFPEGIPDSCNEVMAREDAPFKSYLELRKIMGRSPAYTNRKNWLDLIAGESGDAPGPVDPELEFTWSLDKTEFTEVGQTAKATVNVAKGEFTSITLNQAILARVGEDEDAPEYLEVSKYDAATKSFTMKCIALPADEDYVTNYAMSAVDKATGEEIGSPTGFVEVTVKKFEVPVVPVIGRIARIDPSVVDTEGTMVKLTAEVLNGEAERIEAQFDDAYVELLPFTVNATGESLLTFHVHGQPPVGEPDEVVQISLTFYGKEEGNNTTTPVSELTVKAKEAPPELKLSFAYQDGKDALTKPGDTTKLILTVESGSLGEASPVLSMSGSEAIAEVDTYDPSDKSFTITSRYEGTANDIVVKPVVYVNGNDFKDVPQLTLAKQVLPALSADWALAPSLLSKGQSAATTVTIKEGKASGFRVVPSGANKDFVEVTTVNDMEGRFSIKATKDAETSTKVDIGMYAMDASTKKEIFLGNKSLTITAQE